MMLGQGVGDEGDGVRLRDHPETGFVDVGGRQSRDRIGPVEHAELEVEGRGVLDRLCGRQRRPSGSRSRSREESCPVCQDDGRCLVVVDESRALRTA
jgi:hypothetical protein